MLYLILNIIIINESVDISLFQIYAWICVSEPYNLFANEYNTSQAINTMISKAEMISKQWLVPWPQ